MNYTIFIPVVIVLLQTSCSGNRDNKVEVTQQRAPVKCMENSPERRGEEGCTILANRPLVGSLNDSVYWHLDQYETLQAAQEATGPNSVAAEAHGSFWLLTVEPKTDQHSSASHIAWIGPIEPPNAADYMMRVQSSLLTPGSTTYAHQHSGPEVIYVVDGEQCMETANTGNRIGAGQSLIVPTGGVHRGTVSGSQVRRALALILYDSARPASEDLKDTKGLVECK